MQAVQTESVQVAVTAATADSIRAETNGDRSRVQRKAIRIAEGRDAQPEDELGYAFESDPRKRKSTGMWDILGYHILAFGDRVFYSYRYSYFSEMDKFSY
jgi:hypothetical protein